MANQDNDILARMMASNCVWAEHVNWENPGFFDQLSKHQTPRVLWIGCSDSRVPGNESMGVMPGEVFFHRNIANQMQMVDFNGLAVLQYAVEWLRVRHIIVCGHYGCGGVKTALKQNELGLLNNWLFAVGELDSKAQRAARRARPQGSHRRPVRAERDRAGAQRLPQPDRAAGLAPRSGCVGARLDLQP